MNVRCSSGSTSLAKKIRSLKLRSSVTSHRKLTTTIWEAHWSWSLKTTREVAQELIVNYSTVVWHLKQILKVKKLDTRVPHELPQIKKIVVLKCCFSSMQQQPFLNWIVKCNEKWILCDNQGWQAQSWTEKTLQSTSQSQTCTLKRVMVTVWWFVAGLIHYSLLNPSETVTSGKYAQHIDETHRELRCLQPALVNRVGPMLLHDNTWLHVTQPTSKVERIGLQSFASSGTFTWPLANWLALEDLDNLLQRKGFHNQEEAENSIQEFVESQSLGF